MLVALDAATIGQTLRAARRKKGYTQADAATLLQLGSRTVILRIEEGTRNVTVNELIAFSRLYDVPVDALLGLVAFGDITGDGDEPPSFDHRIGRLSKRNQKAVIALLETLEQNEMKWQCQRARADSGQDHGK